VAEKKAASDSSAMSLMLVLQAYEEVLQQHGLVSFTKYSHAIELK
jgi:hypothetical protein